MARIFDIVIAGNGSIGMTLAAALARAGSSTQIAVVGPPLRRGSASLAAGAMINVWAEMESGCMEEPPLAAKFALARSALHLWDEHVEALSGDDRLSRRSIELPLAVDAESVHRGRGRRLRGPGDVGGGLAVGHRGW